ncbi:MAG TPA: ADP-forming succinate--CoA ligase subunit beta [Chloroflexota bacterium]|nr:ADP-forming succinate--CoA ligase subunit beta [Chloroflexota bacterium]
MKLYEFQAKELFAQDGIPVPSGRMVTDSAGAAAAARELGRCVVKAQVHAGGRGKAGLIKLAESPEQASELAGNMLGQSFKGFRIGRLLIEEAVDIAAEFYLAVTVDRASKSPVMIASAMGGVDIEEVAAGSPGKIANLIVDVAYGPFDFQLRDLAARAALDPGIVRQFVDVARRLYGAFLRSDASLAEINPLMVTRDGKLIAADAKFDVDDNALFRHPELLQYKEEAEEDPIEAEAHRKGVTYVRLGGDIGIIGNGAGIVMSTLDLVAREGGKPANFLDIGGGARADQVREALGIILMDPNVKGVLFNIFGGITRGDEVAKGVLEATASMDVKVPMVLRMAGTRAEEGLKLLEGSALVPAAEPVEAARKIIALAKGA